MSSPASLLGGIAAVYLAAVASPGPNTFLVTRLALAEGRRPAFLAVLGVTTGNFLWLSLTLGGAHLLFERVPVLGVAIRVLGALFMGWLGVRSFRAAWVGGDLLVRVEGQQLPVGSSYRAGILTSLTNPNTLPFYLTLLSVTIAPAVPFWVRFAASGLVLFLCVLWYGGLAVGFSLDPVQLAYRRWARVVNVVLGILLFWVGWKLVRG